MPISGFQKAILDLLDDLRPNEVIIIKRGNSESFRLLVQREQKIVVDSNGIVNQEENKIWKEALKQIDKFKQ